MRSRVNRLLPKGHLPQDGVSQRPLPIAQPLSYTAWAVGWGAARRQASGVRVSLLVYSVVILMILANFSTLEVTNESQFW